MKRRWEKLVSLVCLVLTLLSMFGWAGRWAGGLAGLLGLIVIGIDWSERRVVEGDGLITLNLHR